MYPYGNTAGMKLIDTPATYLVPYRNTAQGREPRFKGTVFVHIGKVRGLDHGKSESYHTEDLLDCEFCVEDMRGGHGTAPEEKNRREKAVF